MKARLTPDQLLAYLLDPTKCPVCKSSQLEGTGLIAEGDWAVQNMNCIVCKAEWQDRYKLHDIWNIELTNEDPNICSKCGQAFAVHMDDGSCVDDEQLEREANMHKSTKLKQIREPVAPAQRGAPNSVLDSADHRHCHNCGKVVFPDKSQKYNCTCGVKSWSVLDNKQCPICRGTGKQHDENCPHCDGYGYLPQEDEKDPIKLYPTADKGIYRDDHGDHWKYVNDADYIGKCCLCNKRIMGGWERQEDLPDRVVVACETCVELRTDLVVKEPKTPRCSACNSDLSKPRSLLRTYIDKGDKPDIYCWGHLANGHFEPDGSVDLSGGRYDLTENSDSCQACGECL